MPTDYGRFALTVPNDADAPNGPQNFRDLVDDLEKRLAYAGAQGGFKEIAADQLAAGTSLAVLGTPDRVSNLICPAAGLLHIRYTAEWKNSVANAGGANIVARLSAGGPDINLGVAAIGDTSTGAYQQLGTTIQASGIQDGLATVVSAGGYGAGLGPDTIVVPIQPAGAFGPGIPAGTYDVEVQFRRSSGTLNVRNRLLRSWTKEFPATGV